MTKTLFERMTERLKDPVEIPTGEELREDLERYGRSALPRFNPYAIPTRLDPKAVDCPYCVKRPRNLRAHCRAVHPDKPEAR
jgi:hypothetical protein